jgi:hypothetical protein
MAPCTVVISSGSPSTSGRDWLAMSWLVLMCYRAGWQDRGTATFWKRLGPTAWRGSTYHTSAYVVLAWWRTSALQFNCSRTPQHFPTRIGRAGPVAWPLRLPDLNPLDFYLRGHLKTLVYSSPIPDVDILRQRVVQGCASIRRIDSLCERIGQSVMRRAQLCVAAGGGHFEHLLWCERPSCTIIAVPC